VSYGGTQTIGNALGQGATAQAIQNSGGGGGGYWGGGTNTAMNVGGAGGSSWVSLDGPTSLDTRSAVGTVHNQGVRNGNGTVSISSPMTGIMPAPTNATATGQLAQVALNWTPSVVDAATGYRIMWGTTLGSLTNQIDVAGSSSSSYVHTGLTVGTTYYYQIATKYADLSQSCTTGCVSAYSNVFYATPIFYPAEFVPEAIRAFYTSNPIYWGVAFSRWIVLGKPVALDGTFLISLAICAVLIAVGYFMFAFYERGAVDAQ
jgi:hypothetical protein